MKAFLFLIAALPSLAFATAQTGDTLIYKGEPESISSTPLEGYFTSKFPRPTWLTQTSTACWRGYHATWELRDKRLYLKKIEREELDKKKKDYIKVDITKRIFPEASPPIEATWFTGTIRMPQGAPLSYAHLGFESIYERDLYLKFEKGVLKQETLVDNKLTPPPGLGGGRLPPPPPKTPAK